MLIRLRIGLIAFAFLGFGVLNGWLVIDQYKIHPRADFLIAGLLFASILAAPAYGLLTRKYWGRWLAMGFALNFLALLGDVQADWHAAQQPEWWCWLAGALTVLLGLRGTRMEACFEGRSERWRNLDPGLRWIRTAIIWNLSTLVLLTMIVIDARLSGRAGALATTALACAALLPVLGCVLCAKQMVAGLFTLNLSFVVWLAIAWMFGERILVFNGNEGFFAVGSISLLTWAPAAIAGIISLIALARPMWRFLRA